MYKKILVPVDGSALAEAVLPHVEALAQLGGAEILLLRVSVDPAAEFAFNDPAVASDMVRKMEEQARIYMQGLASRLSDAGHKVSILTQDGPVAETILNVATETGADMIAMSTHGRSGIQRWLLGSVADRVVNHSSVPVMLIRPRSV